MDQFIDSLDLMTAAQDDQGNPMEALKVSLHRCSLSKFHSFLLFEKDSLSEIWCSYVRNGQSFILIKFQKLTKIVYGRIEPATI